MKNIPRALKEVYAKKQYIVITLLFAFFIFSLNVLIINYKLLISNFSFSLLFAFLIGSVEMMSIGSFIFMILVSLLSGVVLSMSVFVLLRQIAHSIGMGTSGVLLSIAAPSCPSCAIGLFSVIGLGGFLSILPFRGLELRFLAAAVLLASVAYLAKKISTKTCSIRTEATP